MTTLWIEKGDEGDNKGKSWVSNLPFAEMANTGRGSSLKDYAVRLMFDPLHVTHLCLVLPVRVQRNCKESLNYLT